MRFQRENGGIVSFNKSAIKTLLKYRQLKYADKEAGGMLFGRLLIDCDDIIVDDAMLPFSSDKRSRFSFFRGKNEAQKLVNKKWHESNSTQIYLGEWHTHPEDDPTPSANIDIKNWHEITHKTVFEQECLYFVIVGRKKTRSWELNKTSQRLVELTFI